VVLVAHVAWRRHLAGDRLRLLHGAHFAGDLVIARDIEPSIGDVIVYAPESLGGSQVVHRIIGGDAESGWQLQGDNNDFVDPFTPVADEVNGVVVVHYTNLGRLSALLLSPIVWACVLVVAIGLLLWFSDDCEDEDEEDENAADSTPAEGAPHADGTFAPLDPDQSPAREPVAVNSGTSS
jgi:signal peptidase